MGRSSTQCGRVCPKPGRNSTRDFGRCWSDTRHVSAYLVRAVRNRFLQLKRAAIRRANRYARAAQSETGTDGALAAVMSEHARRACEPSRVAEEMVTVSSAMSHFAQILGAQLSTEEHQMLAWVAEGVPRRVIAEWLGINREAAKK